MDKYLFVLLGGGMGLLARCLATPAILNRSTGRLPLGAVIVNLTGCFLIGAIMTVLTQKTAPHPNWRLFLVVGFLGGYTTFSSFAWETYTATRDGGPWVGLLNVIISVILGYFAV